MIEAKKAIAACALSFCVGAALVGVIWSKKAVESQEKGQAELAGLTHRRAVDFDPLFSIRDDIEALLSKDPHISLTYTHVPGNNFHEFRNNEASYRTKMPEDWYGNSYLAWTYSRIEAVWDSGLSSDGKPWSRFNISGYTTIRLPFAEDFASWKQEEKEFYQEFIQALWDHEMLHYQMGVDATNSLVPIFQAICDADNGAIGFKSKEERDRIFKAAIDKQLQDLANKNVALDRQTNHGVKEGADLSMFEIFLRDRRN